MLSLIGVDHRVQAKPKGSELSEEQRRFSHCLTTAIKGIKPVLVAEEYSEEALRMCAKRTGIEHESVTRLLSQSLEVEHRFCDPEADARREMEYVEGWQIAIGLDPTGLSNQELNDKGLALEIAEQWPKRERFWLDRIGLQEKENVVFVVGQGHIDTFRNLLGENGIESEVLALGIGVRPEDDDEERLRRAKAYLEAHPELL